MKSKLLAFLLMTSAALLAGEPNTLPPPPPATGNVTLTLEEYNRLVERAGKPIKRPELPPIAYALKRAELKLRIANESVLGTVQLEGETFNKGVTKVPLTTGLTILDARQDGKGLPLLQDNGTHVAVLPGPAEFSVMLDTGLPLNVSAGNASFTLPVPSAGSARLALVIPGDHTNVRVSPGLITSRTSQNGTTAIEATLVPGQTASIWWTTREIAAPAVPRESRFLSSVKTLVSVNEAEVRIGALADVTVLQGEPSQFVVETPAGWEVTGVSGPTLESSEVQPDGLLLRISAPAQHNHQFLITMEKSVTDSKTDAPFLSFKGSQRETGEVLVEGTGTIELTAKEAGGLKRMDLKETNPYLRSLSRFPLQAAFRYHRQPAEIPGLHLEWVRFPDSGVLAAVAEQAVVTTLVTSEGRSLTEVRLTVKNQAQPFLKVGLPQGATILSAEVAGEKVKPVEGPDGNRVPLLRPGFRPTGSYNVSFVFMHSGAPFAKKGGSELDLPRMDVPIDVLEWEVFLPEQYKVKDFGGDAIAANLVPEPVVSIVTLSGGNSAATGSFGVPRAGAVLGGPVDAPIGQGQIGGVVTDPQGAVVSGATVKVRNLDTGAVTTATADYTGNWRILGQRAGRIKIEAASQGFKTSTITSYYDGYHPLVYNFRLTVGTVSETVEVSAEAPIVEYPGYRGHSDRDDRRKAKKEQAQQETVPSSNVVDLQRRVAGVLPVRVDVPRAGNSYRFVRPLVLDEETKVTFSYKASK